MLDLTTRTSLSPIRRGFAPSFVNYKKGCTRLATASDKDYQLLAQGRWFFPGTPASSTTKTGRHDIAEILLQVALNTKIQIHIQILLGTSLKSERYALYIIITPIPFHWICFCFYILVTRREHQIRYLRFYYIFIVCIVSFCSTFCGYC